MQGNDSAALGTGFPNLQERYRVSARVPRNSKPSPVGGASKRAVDLVGSLCALVLLFIPLVLIALAVRMTSPGPALFRQRRVGLAGRVFIVYKFRTMRAQDDGKAVVQASRRDARVTAVGAFLRKTSLDELPQLLNVLRGDMSLIGPRPHAVAHDRDFANKVVNYRKRWRARPGISGLAQINGSRGLIESEEDIRRRANLDADYVDRWCLWLDGLIVVRTLIVAFKDEAAF